MRLIREGKPDRVEQGLYALPERDIFENEGLTIVTKKRFRMACFVY